MKGYSIIFLVCILAVNVSCKKGKSCLNKTTGLVTEYFDCGYVIKLNNESLLIPLNMEEIDFTFSEGQTVKFSYKVYTVAVTCLDGLVPIEIKFIKLD